MKSRFVIYIPTDTREATVASLTKVAGVPLFLRSVLALSMSGEENFTVIAPSNLRRQILKSWQKITKNRDIHLNLILTQNGNKLSRSELEELAVYSTKTIYFINANYVLPDLSKLPLPTLKPNEVQLLKPTTKRGAIVGIDFSSFRSIAEKTLDRSCEDILSEVANKLNRRFLGAGDDGIIIQKFSEVVMAEQLLAESIRKNTQTWVAREINKRISLPISLILAHFRVSPNTITVVNILIGLCAGIGSAGLTYFGVLMGAILFQTASVIDGCDGEVAKLTFRTSKFGQYIDSISDNLSLAAFLTGMMIHQYRITDSMASFVWGFAMLLGAFCILGIMADYLRRFTNSASFVTYDKEVLQNLSPERTPKIILVLLKYFKAMFKKDLFSLMFLLFAIFGILHLWFYIVAIGVWAGVIILGYLTPPSFIGRRKQERL